MLIKFVKLKCKFSRQAELPNLGSYRLVSCMNMITFTLEIRIFWRIPSIKSSFVWEYEELCWPDPGLSHEIEEQSL